MVIIFYDSDKGVVYISSERDKMKTIAIDDPDLLSHVPNDDILYVQNGQYITKKQLNDWLTQGPDTREETHRFTGFMDDDAPTYSDAVADLVETQSQYKTGKWIHPAHNGAIRISDIKTPKYPEGIELIGKYDFLPVDAIGGFDVLEESLHYRTLLAKGKIKIVDYDYVKQHQNKKHQKSLADAALDAILVKSDSPGSAQRAADSGGFYDDSDGTISFTVE